MKRFVSSLIAACVFLTTLPCLGQGILIGNNPAPIPLPRPIIRPGIPAPTQSYKIKELSVHARISDQVARLQVTQSFVNTGSATMEVSFCFPLPYDGAVNQMTFMVDGKEYEAKLLPAKEAKEIYLNHVRRNEDPALLEWIGTGMFKTSVFPIPPGAERKVSIQLTQLLRKTDRLTDFLYPLSTARFTSQAVETLSISTTIESATKIKNVYSPTHAVDIKRPDDNRAVVNFEAKNTIPANDFRLMFDTAQSEVGASLISYKPESNEDGYFLLLASPEVKSAASNLPSKTVIFVVDRSGSMSGKKIEQARDALRFVLNNLREGDLFNIVAYDNAVESFRPELQRFGEQSRKEALGFVDGIHAGGSTNIGGALTTALKMIQDSHQPSFVVFLTDGLPTSGETNEMKIAELVRLNNTHRSRIVSLGVGYDVNSRLLDRISRDNYGLSEFVRPDEDIEQYVSRLYSRISSPVMNNVELAVVLDDSADQAGAVTNRVYPRRPMDLFAGEQLVIVGRYKSSGSAKVTISGSVGDTATSFDFPVNLVEASSDQTFAFVETLWAIRRIGEIIDELDLSGTNQELVDELVALSTKHGIITPYTSFLADETSTIRQLADVGTNTTLARQSLTEQLSQAEGRFGFEQRAAKKSMREANQVPQFGGFGLGDASEASPSVPATSGGLGMGGRALQNLQGQRLGQNGIALSAGSQAVNSVAEQPVQPLANSVQNVGNVALFKRGNIWVAENARDVDPEKDQDKIRSVERFSDEYFQLVADNSPEENALLASQKSKEELLVKFRGQYYLIR